jgi:hypothetical protein
MLEMGRRLAQRLPLPVAGVLCLCVGYPVLLAVLTGSLSIPHNDTWAYSLIAQHYAQSGSFGLLGWGEMGLAGQVIVLGPLGSSIIIQHLLVALLAAVGLLATYGWLVPRVGTSGALLGTALIGLTPDFGLLATSYMTDIPAYTAVIGCLFLTDQALRTQDARYLLGALAVGTWGVTVRELAIVGPVVSVVVTVAAWRGRKRWIALVGGVISAVAIFLFEIWRRSLPFGDPPSFRLNPDYVAVIAISACFTVAFAVFPAVLVTARPGNWSWRARLMSAVALLVSVTQAYLLKGNVFLPNYFAQGGAYSEASIGTRSVLPDWWWFALVAMACVSFALIVGHLVNFGVSLDRISGLVLLLMVGGTLAQAMIGQLIFARYLLVIVLVACVPLLDSRGADERSMPRQCNRLLSLVAVACLAATSAAITANALARDAAKWQAASSLVARGVAATDIDAGLEWVGYHASEPASRSSAHANALPFYMRYFERSRECYVVSVSPLDAFPLVSMMRYRTYAVAGSSRLWVYQVSPCR